MDFDRDIRLHIQARFAGVGLSTAGLAGLSTASLLIRYFNAAGRFVSVRPRRVHRSPAFDATLAQQPADIQAAAAHIIGDIETGVALTRYLSTGIEHVEPPTNAKPTLAGRRDLDLMLNAWGVHHLHLSTAPGKGRFVQRTGPLLFAVFRPADAYLVDILPHGSWYARHILEVMARTWPDAGLMLKSPSGVRLAQEYTEDDDKVLREGGVSATGVMIDDELWSPTAVGITLAGTSVMHTVRVNGLMHHLRWLRDKLAGNPRFLEEQFDGVEFPAQPSWTFYLDDEGYGVQELHSGAKYILRELALPDVPLDDEE